MSAGPKPQQTHKDTCERSRLRRAPRIGKKSTRLVRAASLKLSQELVCMKDRGLNAMVTVVKEGTESQVSQPHGPRARC